MGCADSTPRVANSRSKASSRNNKTTPTNTVLQSVVVPEEVDEYAKIFREDMQQIFQGIARFSKSEGMVPVVSVAPYSCQHLVLLMFRILAILKGV